MRQNRSVAGFRLPVTSRASPILLALIVAASSTGRAQQPDPLARLAWLAGCWELQRGPRTTIEMWMRPDAGLMLGASRTTVAGRVTEFEHLRLRADGERVIFTALPSGQSEASFTGTEPSDSGFTVANPAHDFPQRIIYRRRGADSLIARIEGGERRSMEFPMRKVSCGT
jgi:hypothetical protein